MTGVRLFAIHLLCALPLLAAGKPDVLSSYFVDSTSTVLLRQLNERFDVERKIGDGYEVIVPAARAGELLKAVPAAVLVERDIQDVFRRLDRSSPGWRDGYHNFDSVQSELKEIADAFPKLASVESYGNSEDGRPLTVIKLTSDKHRDGKAEILITSSTHGDELTTVELTMTLMQELVQGYGTDARITKMLDTHVVYFIPVLCTDGYVNHSRYTNGIDPNRNYPYPDEPDRRPNAAIANEIAWVAKHKVVGSLDIHSNLSTVMYPYAYSNKGPDEEDLPKFLAITELLAGDTGYNHGQIAQVFGIARGSSADYWYWQHKTIALGYEVGGSVVPPSSQLPQFVSHNREAIWHFIENF